MSEYRRKLNSDNLSLITRKQSEQLEHLQGNKIKQTRHEPYGMQTGRILGLVSVFASCLVAKRSPRTNPQSEGFQTAGKRNSNKEAEEYILAGKWDDAIKSFASTYNAKHMPKEGELFKKVFNQAVNAGLSNNDKEALALHCKLLALNPTHRTTLRNFSLLLKRNGQLQAALKFINKALILKPECPESLNTLGTILTDMGRNQEAIDAFKQSLERDPSSSNTNNNIANQYHLNAEIDKAFIHSSKAVSLENSRPELWIDHLTHLKRVCDYKRLEKIHWWNIVMQIPAAWTWTSFLQLLTLCESDEDQFTIKSIIERWGKKQAEQAEEQPINSFKRPPLNLDTPLRIGFISADFRDHSVARFIYPLFKYLNRQKYSLFCYSTFQHKDEWRSRFEAKSDKFREVHTLSPQQLVNVIRNDQIHVLFDLTGFTNGSRTGSLAWRAAPAQVSWLGFPGTSGLKTMDYLFLDQYLTPVNLNFITEKPLQSKGTTVCFSEIANAPITPTIPEIQRGYLTFGTLNNTYKMTRKNIQRWGCIMKKVENSQFLFARREFESHLLRQNIIQEFENLGIEKNRIHFYNNRAVNRHYLDCYNEIDITLDTYPVTGGTTTTDALWMGVPVVGLEGPNIHQRVCSAILQHAGHAEWIARTDEEYINIACNLANNQTSRIKLRQTLREELKKSLLYNSKQFAEDFSDCMEKLATDLRRKI